MAEGSLDFKKLIEDIKREDDSTETEVIEELEITKEDFDNCLKKNVDVNSEMYNTIKEKLGFITSELEKYIIKNKESNAWYIQDISENNKPHKIELLNKYLYENISKENIKNYRFEKNKIKYKSALEYKMNLLKNLRVLTRKPVITFNGKTSSGKSTLINTIIADDLLPYSKKPETSALIKILHSENKPKFLNENDVAVFQKKFNPNKPNLQEAIIDPMLLHDEGYFKENCIEVGNKNLISSYGSNDGDKYENDKNIFTTIVVYHNASILKLAELWDIPGSHSSSDKNTKDSIIAETVRQDADIRLYLSYSGSFLSDEQKEIMNEVENLNVRIHDNPLSNLFIIATKAGSIDPGEDFNIVINNRIDELWRYSGEQFIDEISKNINDEFTKEKIINRVFKFERDGQRINRNLKKELMNSLEQLADKRYEKIEKELTSFNASIKTYVGKINDSLSNEQSLEENARKEYEEFIDNKDPAIKEYRKLLDSISTIAQKLQIKTKEEIQSAYQSEVNEKFILSEIDRKDLKDKKKEKSEFISAYINDVQIKLENVIKKNLETFSKETNEKINEIDTVKLNYRGDFDYKSNAVVGLASLASVGAFSWYFSTLGNLGGYIFVTRSLGQLASVGIKLGSTANILRGVSVLGGPLTIAANLAILGGQLGVTIYKKGKWKQLLANKVIKTLKKPNKETKLNLLNYYVKKSDDIWADTKNSLDIKAFIYQLDKEEDDLRKVWEKYKNSISINIELNEEIELLNSLEFNKEFKILN